MQCINCGTDNRDSARFCAQCGKPLPTQPLPRAANRAIIAGTMLVNRYKIDSLLGIGGFGAVYLAEDTRLMGKRCAIKEAFDTSPDFRRQFELEARLLAQLDYPHLVKVSDFFSVPSGEMFLVMEYVEGEDLLELLTRSPQGLDEDEVTKWMMQVCEVLEYMHNWVNSQTSQPAPIIHRDIKPSNIKLCADGNIKVIDLGIAKEFSAGGKTTHAARAVSPPYSPPEQYGHGTDERSDIYAVGVTMYHLLTGQLPPAALDLINSAPRAPRLLRSQLSTALEQVILKAMAARPEERYATARDLHHALQYPAERRVLTVGETGKYKAIYAAMMAARPGDTIKVAAGEYHEVVVMREGTQVIGAGAETTILEYEGKTAVVIVQNVQHGRIEGLTIRHVGEVKAPAMLLAKTNVTVARCVVSSETWSGMEVADHAAPRLIQNVVENCAETGVFVRDEVDLYAENNTIRGNKLAAMEVRDKSRAEIVNNLMEKNGLGVNVHTTSEARIAGNTIRHNGTGREWHGVIVKKQSRAEIMNNVIEHNVGALLVYDDAQARAENNLIRHNNYENKGACIETENSTLDLINNTIEWSHGTSILYWDNAQGRIEGNTIRHNGIPLSISGMQIRGNAAPTIIGNTIEDNGSSGILVSKGANPRIEGNIIRNNGNVNTRGAGIEVREGAMPIIIRNHIEGHKGSGIYVHDRAAPRIAKNRLIDNDNGALEIEDDCEAILGHNDVG